MKQVRRLFAFALALVMTFAIALPAIAQTEGTAVEGKGSITIKNAAKGELYSVVKIFDAKLSSDNDPGISYTGTIPSALGDYFQTDSTGNIIKKSGVADADIATAVADYAKSEDAPAPVASATSNDGSALTFQGLDYGYYAVLSSQGTAVTINSTKPDVTIYDKNTKEITVEKNVEQDSYSIGDTVNYTATFETVNFYGSGDDAKQVIKYTITDTLPEFLSNVVIDSVTVTRKDGTTTDETISGKTFTNGSFDIDWATEVPNTSNPKQWTSKYENGAKIIVNYHGILTSVTNINTADTNTIKIQPTVVKDDGTPDDEKPWDENWQDDATIKTYAAALKKTDENSSALAGAEFKFKGLTVAAGDAAGEYIVVSYDPTSNVESDALATNSDGKLYIVGLASGAGLRGTETKAPDGYNKLNDPITLTPQVMTEAIYTKSGTIYYDAKGNVVSQSSNSTETKTVDKNLTDLDPKALQVKNQKGTTMPSTGGIGTTIFYVVGGVMVAGAVVFLLTKRRVNAE